MKTIKITTIALFIIIFSTIFCSAQKRTFPNVEVEKFTVKEKVEFEEENLKSLMTEIITALRELNKFQKVNYLDATSEKASEPTLKITGEVTKYSKGNRAARYLVGFGAGATKVKAKVKFFDSISGDLLLEKEIDGAIYIGLFGGKSDEAKSDLAKDIANVVKKQFADNSKKKN